ncbi:3-deoxy-manno-octulosonate cytidylyltransferase [Chlorobium sp. N1]|uniref:3-deoxy-manno-octulosonate cytidylyltransferase n=1 Tax=Chlorobium sp. N1 TaxID=2491138 RepID=UPI00103919F8|nr:3-deoxy-manno-octulosonate cytidylyltransferase [Chlorobium sp. N1]TCD47916.1 3-deoxy-manno-octulosonate cytidylyltransferase [Chlorobium sp. N1]
MNAAILIPARLDSSRLPRKMLADLEGEPLIVRTWRQAMKSRLATEVVVAADSPEIVRVLEPLGARVVLTPPELSCGSERIAMAARGLDADVLVNLQGDEPLISPENIDLVLRPYFDAPEGSTLPDCTTLVFPIGAGNRSELEDPHVVKVVMDCNGRALYFSRSPVPYVRNASSSLRLYRHVGLYAFRADVLQRFASMPVSMLEAAESLEQLRLLENGFSIRCMETSTDSPGVNTAEDLELVRRILRGGSAG